jgi:hypothetical protein
MILQPLAKIANLEAGFSRSTNNLPMALRFYKLRRQPVTNAIISAGPDHGFTNIVSGKLNAANLQLKQLAK